jgi:hypothetical protein
MIGCIKNNEFERIWKEEVLAMFKVLSQNFVCGSDNKTSSVMIAILWTND